MPKLYMIMARKIFSRFFFWRGGRGLVSLLPPSSTHAPTRHLRTEKNDIITHVQRGNFQVDRQLYNLSPLSDPQTAKRHGSRAYERPATRVSIGGVDHLISPVSLDDIRLCDTATPRTSHTSRGIRSQFTAFVVLSVSSHFA